jgi:hypothetical protein
MATAGGNRTGLVHAPAGGAAAVAAPTQGGSKTAQVLDKGVTRGAAGS